MRMKFWKSWAIQCFIKCLKEMSLGSAVRFVRLQQGGLFGDVLEMKLNGKIQGVVAIRTFGSDADTMREICLLGVYDQICSRVPSAKSIVDLGANIGLATRLFAARYPAASIVAVEPDPQNFAMLNRNTHRQIEQGRCRLIHAAIWDKDGDVSLQPSEGEGQFDSVRTTEAQESGSRVRAITMETLLNETGLEQIDILKIDIEGAEVELLRSAPKWLNRVQSIAAEFHGASRRESGFDDLMQKNGFHIVEGSVHTVMALRNRLLPDQAAA